MGIRWMRFREHSPARRAASYGIAIVSVLLATGLRALLDPVLEGSAPFSIYFAALMVTAWYGGLGPAIFVLAASVLSADYFFIAPRGNIFLIDWIPYDVEHRVSLLLFLFVGGVIIAMSESLHISRRRAEAARAELAEANYSLQKEIAERERAEQWLLESEQRFRGYFEQGLVGMAMLSADKQWIEVNQRLCRLLGYSEEELFGKTWAELTHPDDLPSEEAHFRQMLNGIVKGFVMEKRLIGNGGKVVCASVSVQCMRKDDGTLDCILVLVQDMTARQHAAAKPCAEKERAGGA